MSKPLFFITVGASASGKSTLANTAKLLFGNDLMEVNRDQIRSDLFFSGEPFSWHEYLFSTENEDKVQCEYLRRLALAFEDEYDIFDSNTNLNRERLEKLILQQLGFGYAVRIIDLTNVELSTLIYRNNLRKNKVPDKVLATQFLCVEASSRAALDLVASLVLKGYDIELKVGL